ncbi:MAG: aldehyde oxidase, partial [Chloroflexi bacterium]|nr:aldehyde oxidase [Chloroflexota bacterium]
PEAPGGNEVYHRVQDYGDVDAAFAEADVVVHERFVVHRHSATPLEGLAAIASYEPTTGQTTFWANIGNLGRFTAAARALKLDHADLRLIVPDVGGSFGVKALVHQRAVLLAVLSRKVGRPVKWTEDRLEHLGASHHATSRIAYAELAGKRDGTILGRKIRFIDDQGAYVVLHEPYGPNNMFSSGIASCYTFGNARVEAQCVLTNKCLVYSNRSYGKVQAVFSLERIVDRFARAIDMDPTDVRLKNVIPPEAYPYTTPSGVQYDSGDPGALLRKTKEILDYDSLRRLQADERDRGRLLGIGCALSVESGGPTRMDIATVLLDPDGRLMVQTPTLAQGQGHETTIAQIVGDRFDVDPDSIHVTVQLDSRTMPYTPASGTFASKFSSSGGPAVYGAAQKLADQLAALAANVLDANPKDIEFRDGTIVAADKPERSLSLRKLAEQGYRSPGSFGRGADVSLQATYLWAWPDDKPGARSRGATTFALICHGALVEIDPETGVVTVLKYVSTEDCGRVINPTIVHGQTMGAFVHGLGWALNERLVYDDAGQLLTGTFMDYLPTRFSDVPPLEISLMETPTPFSPLGAKGMAESGSAPPPACIANAVEDAIYHLGGRITDSHLTPETVLRALRGGREIVSAAALQS